MKGAVASGHPLTCKAACDILEKGGNAFDAVVAAAFASTITEPTLTSLGGGGFLLFHDQQNGKDSLIDFFVNTPGLDCMNKTIPPLIPVDVKFRSTAQTFHIGTGSIAVPGTLKGLIHCHETLCSMNIDDILAPSLSYLKDGVEVTAQISYLLEILRPILTFSAYGREIFDLREGGRLYNPLLLEFLLSRSPDTWIERFYHAEPFPFHEDEKKGQCLLTQDDLSRYTVFERAPLDIPYRSCHLLTNPAPSFGGLLLCLSLSLLEDRDIGSLDISQRALLLVELMGTIQDMRNELPTNTGSYTFNEEKIRACRLEIEQLSKCSTGISRQGTTHISVIDAKGNAASLTSSNGSNSGCFFGDTGIMLNNMMGEDDLHPGGFYTLPPGNRVSSMMSPSFIRKNGDIFAVLGSGGSKRIRTALLQAIIHLIDLSMDVEKAVESPRLHLDDDGILQVEPGFNADAVSSLAEYYALNQWSVKDMYFGGVHTVLHDLSGHGDSRRGGYFMKV